jgi:pimeloyl-ACP methyl ester carboxylesterase
MSLRALVCAVFGFAFLGLIVSTAKAPGAAAQGVVFAWTPCPIDKLPSRECAELIVPLDYNAPDGATISIAVARVPATDAARRIGSLLSNPGGPGGAGVESLPLLYAALPEPLAARFDFVGFDPRGIGESTPVRCFTSIAERTAFFNAVPTVPVGPEQEAERQRVAEEIARRCGERNAALLPHLSTANVARDLDRLRQAVGDDQTTYLASSYGTYLGQTYANLFPDRIRAMVLDGVIDPLAYASADYGTGDVFGPDTSPFLRILSPQASYEAFEQFITRCADAGPSSCAFSAASAADTRARFDALMDRLRAQPVVASSAAGTLTVTYSSAVEAVRGGLYAAPMWSGLAQGLLLLEEGDAAGFLAATHGLPMPLPTTYRNGEEATPSSLCVDTDTPRTPALFEQMVLRAAERTPYFGATWSYITQPCIFWAARDADRYVGPWNVPTSATILLVSRRYDPATGHASAMAAAQRLANARLLTIAGWGHSYFEGGLSTCANEIMAAYLIDRQLPAPDTVCPEDVAPFSEPLTH